MSAAFQSLLALGLKLPYPLSLVYVAFIFVVAVTAILCAGLCLFLAITGSLNFKRLRRGLCLILIVVVPSLSSGIFLKGLAAFAPGQVSDLMGAIAFCSVAVDASAAIWADGVADATSR